MSRIGKLKIEIPAGVQVVCNGESVEVKGKLGSLQRSFPSDLDISLSGNAISVQPKTATSAKNFWGMARTTIKNMITGVKDGFEKKLEMVGVGYKASVDGKYLTMSLGYSHDIKFEIPSDISITAIKPTLLSITGVDRQKVGQVAAFIAHFRPPEPYKGKGIKEEGEVILRKEGKKK